MSTFGSGAPARLRGIDPDAAHWLAAELRNLVTPIHCHLVTPDVESGVDAADALLALLALADQLDAGELVREELAQVCVTVEVSP
jgi:hypothetical protein